MQVRMIPICILAIGAVATPVVAADIQTGNELYRAIVRDSTLDLHLRTYYFDEQEPGASGKEAWAGGGWLEYRSDWIGDVLKFGIVGYTSQPIWAPQDKDGTLLLKPGQQGYGVIGQAYAALKFDDQTLTLYRQSIDQPEVNPQDNRMTPNTFEGVTAAGTLGDAGYFAGYLTQMKPRDEDIFENFASVAGAAGASESMWIGGLNASLPAGVQAKASVYVVPDVLASSYLGADWTTSLAKDSKLGLAGQFMYQGTSGSDLLTGSSFDTWVGGLKADVVFDGLTLTTALTQTGDSAAFQSPYGSWPGYSNMIVKDFDRAGETAVVAEVSFDFEALDLPGLSLAAAAAFGRNAIDSATGAALSDNNEYDLTLDYGLAALGTADWLSPLSLQARAGHLEEDSGGTTSVTNEYRLIANYEWRLNGGN